MGKPIQRNRNKNKTVKTCENCICCMYLEHGDMYCDEHEDFALETCSICGKKYKGYGNNARPVNDGRCCDDCNFKIVIPKRIEVSISMKARKKSDMKGW